MKMTLTQEVYNKTVRLVDCALGVSSKREAEPYIRQLQFMHSTGGYGGYPNVVF